MQSVPAWGVYLSGGVCLPGWGVPAWVCTCLGGACAQGCTFLGVYLPRGIPAQVLPPVNRITDKQV